MRATCDLCFRNCALDEGQTGLCRARGNQNGEVVCLNYGRITALTLEPVERLPLRRFLPNTRFLTSGGCGCNLRCPYCASAPAAMQGPGEADSVYFTPEMLVGKARNLAAQGCAGLAFTAGEPLVGYEYVRDCAWLCREGRMKTVLATNGCFSGDLLEKFLPVIDGVSVALKGFTSAHYQWLGGELQPVKDAVALAAGYCHLEVNTLVVPGMNGGEEEIRALSRWLASLRRDIPLHLVPFTPRYRMRDRPAAAPETIAKLAQIAREHLDWVYGDGG